MRAPTRRWPCRLRRWLEPPRRLRVLRSGAFLIFGTLALGLASLNTGNNLLYLLMGALLGTITLSGWLSEQALRDLLITRAVPRAATAGEPLRLRYAVTNAKRRLPSHGLELLERFSPDDDGADQVDVVPAFVAALEPGAVTQASAVATARRRGVYALDGLILATSFPFGLFAKERDIALPGRLVVWPRTDRPVREPRLGGRHGRRLRAGASAAAGVQRGDYRGLREYRPGDDPRDVHWRSTARRSELIVREYDRDTADEYWIVLDTVSPDDAAGEVAVEAAAALMVRAAAHGDRFGLAAGAARMLPGAAAGRVEAGLDVLAAVHMARIGPAPRAPAPAAQCILVSARSGADGWGDNYTATAEGAA